MLPTQVEIGTRVFSLGRWEDLSIPLNPHGAQPNAWPKLFGPGPRKQCWSPGTM